MNPSKATYGWGLSKHAVQRLYERHPGIFRDPAQVGKARWDSAYRVLDDSEEADSIQNNLTFMMYLHERYGYKRFKFFRNGDVLFVGVEDEAKQIVTTVSIEQHTDRRIKALNTSTEDRFRDASAPARWRATNPVDYAKLRRKNKPGNRHQDS